MSVVGVLTIESLIHIFTVTNPRTGANVPTVGVIWSLRRFIGSFVELYSEVARSGVWSRLLCCLGSGLSLMALVRCAHGAMRHDSFTPSPPKKGARLLMRSITYWCTTGHWPPFCGRMGEEERGFDMTTRTFMTFLYNGRSGCLPDD